MHGWIEGCMRGPRSSYTSRLFYYCYYILCFLYKLSRKVLSKLLYQYMRMIFCCKFMNRFDSVPYIVNPVFATKWYSRKFHILSFKKNESFAFVWFGDFDWSSILCKGWNKTDDPNSSTSLEVYRKVQIPKLCSIYCLISFVKWNFLHH